MSISAGTKLGPYEILSPLGAGGMGEVYLAKDTKLDRKVAIKVLPDSMTRDKERVARFEREAKLLASLTHPNIAAIHGFDESNGTRFLVLEYVEGETLSNRLKSGRLAMDEALDVAKQIAEALEAAHESGVIHRDLKPGNVMIRADGTVKVLDFGLAKAMTEESPTFAADSPTITANYTRPGVILGTAAYMSPEQARGKPLDKRTDIWSYGVVLYECLTGQRPFGGETTSDTIAKILERDPDSDALPGNTPLAIRQLLQRCLDKDRKQRLRDIGEARITIEGHQANPPVEADLGLAPGVNVPASWRRALPWALAGAIVLLGTLAIRNLMPLTPSALRRITRMAISLPPDAPLELETRHPAVALSPKGTRLVYVARRGGKGQLYLHEMDQLEARAIPGTEGASGPFFSPEGQWVAFLADGMLKKVSLLGGSSLRICDVASGMFRGASWGSDNTIVFGESSTNRLLRVSAEGGIARAVTRARSFGPIWPDILPGGKGVLFTRIDRGRVDKSRIGVFSLETGETKYLNEVGTNPRYAPSGHLVFYRADALLAVPFDLERLETIGDPVAVVEDVVGNPSTGAVHFSISSTGDLAYVRGGTNAHESTLVWVDRSGKAEPLPLPARAYEDPRLSPDGKRLAVTVEDDIWVYDVDRGTAVRLTSNEAEDFEPIWTPDGKRVTFTSNRHGAPNLFWKLVDGSGDAEHLSKSEYSQYSNNWSPDGKVLSYTTVAGAHEHVSTWMLRLEDAESQAELYLDALYGEWTARFSPDGQWLAYVSDESGRWEIYVRPYPGRYPKIPISTDGGVEPVWARDGSELFYRNGDKMMVVSITMEPTFSPSKPETLFEERYRLSAPGYPYYDVSLDGQRFVMIKGSEGQSTAMHINVVLNWVEELKRRVPTGTNK